MKKVNLDLLRPPVVRGFDDGGQMMVTSYKFREAPWARSVCDFRFLDVVNESG